ncbi:hlh transcription factor [Diplocarpon rosae]|nr:hlh transcription factor [Diplocarpon rosae]
MSASHVPQGLPSGLAGVLNKPDDHRDSAYYSSKDASSKHNSTQSSHSASAIDSHRSRADSSSATDMTPSPISNCLNTQPLHSPTSGAMSVASIVSPTTYNSFSQQLFEQGQHNSHSGDSRRESVDSRLGANFGDMRLASSPYATWAFPEEEVQRMPSAARPSDELGGSRPATSFYDNSRRNSYADSVASSQYTTESRFPSANAAWMMLRLQHRQVSELQAIAEHERQTKVIEDQKKQLARIEQRLLRSEQDLDISRREITNMRAENAQLRADLAAGQGNGSAASYHHPAPLPHQHSYMPGHDPAQHPVQQQLPPLRTIPGPESMNGVQYQHDQRTPNYR